MVTRLGPATIEVRLSVSKALQDLEGLEKRIREASERASKTTADVRRTEEKETTEREERVTATVKEYQEKARSGRFGVSAMKFAAMAGTVAIATKVAQVMIPAIGQAFETSTQGTLLESAGKGVNDLFMSFSNRLSDVESKVSAAFTSYDDLKAATRAQVFLGGSPTLSSTTELGKTFFAVNDAMARLEKQKDKFLPEYTGKIAAEFFSGGAMK